MDYKQRNEGDFESAKAWYKIVKEQNNQLAIKILEGLFPSLKESDDEMVRKEITAFFKNFAEHETWKSIPDVTKWLAWLEKQGEQKPVDTNLAFKIGDVITDGTSTFKITDIKGEFYIAEDGDHVSFYVAHRYYTTVEHFDSLNPINHLEPLESELDNDEDSNILQRFSFYSYKDEPNILYLSGLYVNEECRNKGIGTKILEVADEVAKSLNCHTIRLKTKKDSNAERLYRTHGYNSLATEESDEIWLEKQGEQEPAWSEEDKDMENRIEILPLESGSNRGVILRL